MSEWLSLEEGLKASGLRIAPVRGGVPSGWSEMCKGFFRVKGIPLCLSQRSRSKTRVVGPKGRYGPRVASRGVLGIGTASCKLA